MLGGLCVENVWLQMLSSRVLKFGSFQINAEIFSGPKAFEDFSSLIAASSSLTVKMLVLMSKGPDTCTLGRV